MTFGEPVTRRRNEQTGTDRYGEPIFETVDTVLEDGAAFDPGGSREPVEVGRTQTVTTPKLYFRGARPDLHAGDRVLMRGVEFQVEGDPADWRSPYGTDLGGLVVELKRAGG